MVARGVTEPRIVYTADALPNVYSELVVIV